MGQVRQDNVQIKLEIDGSQSRTELDNLTRKAQVLTDGMKGLKKGSEEYVAANKELSQVKARMAELREEIGLTSLTTGQLRTLAGQLGRELAQLTPETESFVNKAQELANVEARLAQVRAQAKGVVEEVQSAGGGFGSFIAKAAGFAGVQLGVQAIVGGLKQLGTESVAEFEQAQNAAAQLDAALASTAGAAGLTREELLKLSNDLEGKTIFDGDAVTQAQSVLLTFTKIRKGVYEEALPAIVDMATRLGGDGPADLQGATIQVGKALNDPVKGITALAKAGVSFSEDQKAMIASLVKTGDVAGAQKIILQELKNEFGGSAEAAAKAGTGPLKQFEVQVGNVKEGLGALIVEGLQTLQPVLTVALGLFSLLIDVLRAAPAFLSENKTGFGLLALAVAAWNLEQIKSQANSLKNLALQKLVQLGVITETEGRYALITATELQTAAQTGLNAVMEANPLAVIITLLALAAFGLKQLYDRSETFRAAVDSLWKMLGNLGEVFKGLFTQLGPLATMVGRFFSSFGSGKQVLELFGVVMGVSVVLPLKLLVTNLQLSVDAFLAFLDVGKRVANFFGADFKVDPNGSFDKLNKHLIENGKSIVSTLLGQDQQLQQGRDEAFVQRKAAYDQRVKDFLKRHEQATQALAQQEAAASKQRTLEALKEREASIKAALALVASGSAEELRLKKLEVATKRDIDLLDEKKTAADKKVIRAEALRDLHQLQEDYDKKQAEAAAKRAAEQAAVQKKLADLRAGLLSDETARRIQQLTAAAEQEKATAKGTAEQIAEQRKLLDQKLAVDVAAERKRQADKQAAEELEVEKQHNALLVDAYQRRAAELRTAAKAESLKILDTDSQAAEKRRLVAEKLAHDLVALEQERVAKQAEIAAAIADVDDNIALSRIERRRQQSNEWSRERAQADADELAVRKEQLAAAYQDEYFQQGLSNEQKLAISRRYLQDKEDLENEYADRSREREKAGMEFGLEQTATVIQTVADFEKIASDKQLAKLDKDKAARLAKLEAEYKAGTISKELYEAQKAGIEQNYDEQTREVKRRAAEKEKEFNVAQAIIAGALSVIKASPNVPLMIAAGVTAAAGVAKIIATPIPEFEQGGIFGQAWRGTKQAARSAAHYASGGRINARAGVASVGQRHSGGGIQMLDGATGQHLGEWERGEPYMILSRQTYANNKYLIDELIDTSLHRGGAPVRPQPGYYEDGGTFGGSPAGATTAASQTRQDTDELAQLLRETRDAIRALPSRQYIGWDVDDTAQLEQRLDERVADRQRGSVR